MKVQGGKCHGQMIARTERFEIRTRGRGSYEITDNVVRFVEASGLGEGIVTVFVRHTSASLVIFENADPSARDDLGDLLVAVALARHTVRLLRQDMRLVTATNVAAIGYGVLTPVSALTPMLINNGSWVLATLNSLRPWRPGGGAGAEAGG